MCLAVDRDQSKIVLNYTRSYFSDIDLLTDMIQRETTSGFELNNSVDIAVTTNSFRSVRGRPILCAILDETAFWRNDNSATPDEETYRAIKPALASLPSSIVVGISSPYRKAGLLHRKFKEHFGKDSPDVLVIKAPTRDLNPLISQSIIDEAIAEHPASARAEWMAEFRDDVAAFGTEEAIDKITPAHLMERSPVRGETYFAFVDVSDSMTMAIGHRAKSIKDPSKTIATLDAVREIRAPFSPEAAVTEFAKLLKDYWVTTVNGRVLIEYDNSAAPALNTDLTAEVTCNGGMNWATASLSAVTSFSQGGRKVAETVDQACAASGTSFASRIKTLTNKNVPIYGLSLTAH